MSHAPMEGDGPIRALVVDDSVLARQYLSQLLSADPDIEVVGAASDGHVALGMIERLDPDVVVLDVEMPVMDGLETLRCIKKATPSRRVVMFSAFTTRGAKTTVEALALGAEDYVAKPSNLLATSEARESAGADLIRKIKALTRRYRPPSRVAPTLATPVQPAPVDVVAIASSTGGPNVLADLFRSLPDGFPVPVLVVQHMPPMFTTHLAERLSRESTLDVREAQGGEVLRPGAAWVAPGGYHLVVRRRLANVTLDINEDPPENSVRPSADVLFRSVERCFRGRVLAVVLTGMGMDGLEGARLLHSAGAAVLVQDRESSVVWGMAGSVAEAGLAEAVLPPDRLAQEIIRRARVGR